MLKICLVFWESEPQYAYKGYAYKKKHVSIDNWQQTFSAKAPPYWKWGNIGVIRSHVFESSGSAETQKHSILFLTMCVLIPVQVSPS